MPMILLENGLALIHGQDDRVDVARTDVLLDGNMIVEIRPGIDPPKGCTRIDCSNKILSPGFVDTHNHMWESPLKGVCENLTASSYFATMFTASSVMSPGDVFWGTLGGCMQSIDAGTTTALDYGHMNWTQEHGPEALAGTLTSGIRSVFAYATSMTVKSTDPETMFEDLIPWWFVSSLRKLSGLNPFSGPSPRVRLALGFDFFFLGKETVQQMFGLARSLNLQLVTSHWTRPFDSPAPGLPSLLKEWGLADTRVVISHFGGASEEDCALMDKEDKWYVSSSPSAEMTLALGAPVCFQQDPVLRDTSVSLGVDCHCISSASMVSEMRIALLAARGADAAQKNNRGFVPKAVCRTATDAYLMGTIRGARALGLEHEVGSLKVGKKADIIIFDMLSPAMAPAAQQDPVTAIVIHSSSADIDTVIVDGIVLKANGKLLPVNATKWAQESGQFSETSQKITWEGVVSHIVDIQRRFMANVAKSNLPSLKRAVSSLYGMREADD